MNTTYKMIALLWAQTSPNSVAHLVLTDFTRAGAVCGYVPRGDFEVRGAVMTGTDVWTAPQGRKCALCQHIDESGVRIVWTTQNGQAIVLREGDGRYYQPE